MVKSLAVQVELVKNGRDFILRQIWIFKSSSLYISRNICVNPLIFANLTCIITDAYRKYFMEIFPAGFLLKHKVLLFGPLPMANRRGGDHLDLSKYIFESESDTLSVVGAEKVFGLIFVAENDKI